MPPLDVAAIVASNLQGWANARLHKLDKSEVDQICLAMGISGDFDTKADVVNAILQRKKELQKERASSPLVPSGGVACDEKAVDAAARLLQSKVKSKYRGIFVSRHQLKIMSFNSLKLRTGRVGLQEQWLAFAAMMGEFDVVLMSEVPAAQAEARSRVLLQLIQSCFESEDDSPLPLWSLHISEPSGPGNPEVHVAFVRAPLVVLKQQTLEFVEGVKMDHSPFQILVYDPRFELSKRVLLTHVHMPPAKRSSDRDTQLRLLLRTYPTSAEIRLDMPFDPKAAKERRMDEITHIVCGDFNVYPSEEVYGMRAMGWADPLIPERVSTSSGGNAYDNFIIDRHSATRCSTFSDVLELSIAQNSAAGVAGLSDHDPVVLTLKELPLVGPRSARKVCAPAPEHVHSSQCIRS
jgi:endonuclease/exonuclease/phosphatase family metal-dependent hydrolase